MSTIEVLATIRGTIFLSVLPFAIRADMRFLAGALFFGIVASTCQALGVALVLVGVIAMPLYGCFAIHTLYVTRRRRDQPYLPHRRKG